MYMSVGQKVEKCEKCQKEMCVPLSWMCLRCVTRVCDSEYAGRQYDEDNSVRAMTKSTSPNISISTFVAFVSAAS